jgi:nitrite reductase (NADH) small subunit
MKDSEGQYRVNLGSVEKIPLGQGHCFIVDQKEIAIFRLRSGGLCAMQNRCPHRQGPLCDGVVDERQVICPYHGHKFDLRSGIGSEATERLKVYEVGEEQGEIFLKL